MGPRLIDVVNMMIKSIRLMVNKTKTEFDKYWRNPHTINISLLIAVVSDSRHKLEYVNYFIGLFDDDDDDKTIESFIVRAT